MAHHDDFVYSVICLLVGMGCYFTLRVEPALWMIAVPLVAVAVVRWRIRHNGVLLNRVVMCGLIIALGFAYAQFHRTHIANTTPDPHFANTPSLTTLNGIVDWAEERPNGGRVDFAITDETDRTYKVHLYTTHAAVAALRPGCAATLTADIEAIPPPLAYNGYDPRFVAFYEGIRGRGFLREIQMVDCGRDISFIHQLSRLRLRIAARFVELLPAPQGSVAAALVTGVRGRIPADIRNLFRDGGLAHMLAISGLHMALFAGSFFGLVRLLAACSPWLAQNYNIRKISAGAALLAAVAYLAISGTSYATQRAFIMIALVFIAIIAGRRALTFRNVAWAALLVVLLNPHAMMRAGFQMSFIAVLALVSFYEGAWHHLTTRIEGRVAWWVYTMRDIWRYFLALLTTGIIAGGATGFIALVHFKQIGTYGLFTNLLAMPVFGIITMPMTLPSMLLMPFGLEGFPVALMGKSIEAIVAIATYTTSFEGAVWRVAASPVWVLPLGVSGLTLLCLWRRRFWWLSLSFIIITLAFIGRANMPLVYIYGTGNVIAAQNEAGEIGVIRGRHTRFEVSVWQREHGQANTIAPTFKCPAKNCRLTLKDNVQLVYQPSREKLAQHCKTADIIIMPYRRITEACAAVVIDRRKLVPNRVRIIRKHQDQFVFENIGSLTDRPTFSIFGLNQRDDPAR